MDDPGSWLLLLASVSNFAIVLPIVVLGTLFFSVTSLSFRYLSWVKLEEAFEKSGRPERVRVIRDQLPEFVTCAATLRLLSNLAVLVCIIHHYKVSPLPAFAFSAALLLIFSVAIPQAWAQHAGTDFLVFFYPALRAIEVITWPITAVLRMFDPVVRRLAGVSLDEANGCLEEKQEELMNIVEEGEKEGIVDEQERDMIASVLEFREQTAGEIMTPRTDIIGISATVTLEEACEIITQTGHSRYPVYEENIDQVIGLLYAKDLLRDLKELDLSKSIRHHLRKAYFVPESKCLRDLLADFQTQKIHIAVVLDEYGGTAGVVTIEDIIEELVGEIFDEYEPSEADPIVKLDENTVEVDGRVHVDELIDEFDWEIPDDEDYETIGGFAFSQLGHIPQKGETFQYNYLQFTVTEVEQRKISRLKIFVNQDLKDAGKTNGKKKSRDENEMDEK